MGASDRAPARQAQGRARFRGPQRHRRRDDGRRRADRPQARLLGEERDRLRVAHPRRAQPVLQLRRLQHGLHDGGHADRVQHRRGPAALHLHGQAAGARHPPRRRQPGTGHARLGARPAAGDHAEPQPGGPPRGLRDQGAARPGPGFAGSEGISRHHRPGGERAAGRQARPPRAPPADRDLVDVRRPRHGQQVHLPLLQRGPPRGGHPRGGERDPPRRPRPRQPGRGERVRQHRRG